MKNYLRTALCTAWLHWLAGSVAALLLCGAPAPGCASAAEGGGATAEEAAPPAPPPEGLVLDTSTFWRAHLTRGSELVRQDTGDLVHVNDLVMYRQGRDRNRLWRRLNVLPEASCWPLPPEGWARPDFDDSAWALLQGPFGAGEYKSPSYWYRSIPLICLRGKFEVTDPARVTGFRLRMGIHGGAVVYLNGTELARVALPQGRLDALTPAADYSKDAFLDPQGRLLSMRGTADAEKFPDRFAQRVRRIEDLAVPAGLVSKGVNVLAVEIHRAPAPEVMLTATAEGITQDAHRERYAWWPRAALVSLDLRADPESAVLPNTAAAPRPKGLNAWNHPVYETVAVTMRGGPVEPLRPMRLVGARNGLFSGQVVLASPEAIAGLRAQATALQGPAGAVIPAIAVRVRWGAKAPPPSSYRSQPDPFEVLEEYPPATVAVSLARPSVSGEDSSPSSEGTRSVVGGAVQPVWVSVRVPADAAVGDYRGTVTLSADGQPPIEAPVSLRVLDWTVSDAKDFFAFVGAFQSPDSLAMHYKVPMWSEEHWRLIEKSLTVMGEIGVKDVYITAVRRTHLGNEHSMITWTRRPDGSLKPDFSIAERYLEAVTRCLGRPKVVCLYAFELNAPNAANYPSGATAVMRSRETTRDILISVQDPDTGQLTQAQGPEWGTPECRAFWKEVIDGVRRIVRKQGLPDDALMLGITGDYEPIEEAAEDLKAASGGLLWVAHSHGVRYATGPKGDQPTGYSANAWGGARSVDPSEGRGYCWKTPIVRVVTREFPGEPATQRLYLERKTNTVGAYRNRRDTALHGVGRCGADFWPVLPRGRSWAGLLFARYPESRWGQLNVALWMPALFAPGRDGAVHTVRTEMLRENAQEIEARIFIEKVLDDPAKRALLGEDLADRAQDLLDERVRMALRSSSGRSFMGPTVEERSEALYRLAGEVAKGLARSPSGRG